IVASQYYRERVWIDTDSIACAQHSARAQPVSEPQPRGQLADPSIDARVHGHVAHSAHQNLIRVGIVAFQATMRSRAIGILLPAARVVYVQVARLLPLSGGLDRAPPGAQGHPRGFVCLPQFLPRAKQEVAPEIKLFGRAPPVERGKTAGEIEPASRTKTEIR